MFVAVTCVVVAGEMAPKKGAVPDGEPSVAPPREPVQSAPDGQHATLFAASGLQAALRGQQA